MTGTFMTLLLFAIIFLIISMFTMEDTATTDPLEHKNVGEIYTFTGMMDGDAGVPIWGNGTDGNMTWQAEDSFILKVWNGNILVNLSNETGFETENIRPYGDPVTGEYNWSYEVGDRVKVIGNVSLNESGIKYVEALNVTVLKDMPDIIVTPQ